MVDTKSNPANDREAELQRLRKQRRSLTNATRRLECPDMPGWHLHWFKEDNIPRAVAAAYEFVKRDEVAINQLGAGTAQVKDGNTDLGTNVSIIGDKFEDGSPCRLYLMKLREELFQDDQRELERRNSVIMQAIFGDEAMVGQDGQVSGLAPNTYINQSKALFQRPTRKAKPVRRT
jgi:hypothetical protein